MTGAPDRWRELVICIMASIPSAPASAASSNSGNGSAYPNSFAIMTSLFVLWGFMTVSNEILIPRFKDALTLSYLLAMLAQFAFFGAYFLGSLIDFIMSVTTGDPIAKLGYGQAGRCPDCRHTRQAPLAAFFPCN